MCEVAAPVNTHPPSLSLLYLGVQVDEETAHRATGQSYFHNLSH